MRLKRKYKVCPQAGRAPKASPLESILLLFSRCAAFFASIFAPLSADCESSACNVFGFAEWFRGFFYHSFLSVVFCPLPVIPADAGISS